MIDFDPTVHQIVAVEVATGQHFHVTLPDLARDLNDIRSEATPDGVADVVRTMVEKLRTGETSIAEIAQTVAHQNLALIDLLRRVEIIETANKLLAAEAAKRIAA